MTHIVKFDPWHLCNPWASHAFASVHCSMFVPINALCRRECYFSHSNCTLLSVLFFIATLIRADRIVIMLPYSLLSMIALAIAKATSAHG